MEKVDACCVPSFHYFDLFGCSRTSKKGIVNGMFHFPSILSSFLFLSACIFLYNVVTWIVCYVLLHWLKFQESWSDTSSTLIPMGLEPKERRFTVTGELFISPPITHQSGRRWRDTRPRANDAKNGPIETWPRDLSLRGSFSCQPINDVKDVEECKSTVRLPI